MSGIAIAKEYDGGMVTIHFRGERIGEYRVSWSVKVNKKIGYSIRLNTTYDFKMS